MVIYLTSFFMIGSICPGLINSSQQHSLYLSSVDESLNTNDEALFKPFIQKILDQKKIKIDSIERLASSGCGVFEINHSLIARFSSSLQKMKLEKTILDSLLASNLSVQVPCYSDIYQISENDVYFVLYSKIPGEVLTQEKFQQLTESQLIKLSEDLATFLFHMHHTIERKDISFLETDEMLSDLMPRVPEPDILNEKMEKYLINEYADLVPLWKNVYRAYLDVCNEPKLKAPIHNDLHGCNLLIDPSSNHLLGILDFEDAVYGHILREFRHFYSLDPKFMIKIAKSYAKKIHFPEEVFIRSAFAFRMYRDFTNLWKVIEFPEIASQGDKQSATTLRQFMKSEYFTLLK